MGNEKLCEYIETFGKEQFLNFFYLFLDRHEEVLGDYLNDKYTVVCEFAETKQDDKE